MSAEALAGHLATCATTVCRAWAVTRRDGTELGFTDHDQPLVFEGITFSADSGLSARAIEQTTGLAVDNSEVVGVLTDPAIREADIAAGLFDGAQVRCWIVNWAAVEQRKLVFRGTLGEIERSSGAFRAELRGLAEALNRAGGRVYQKACDAVLGDVRCGVNLDDIAYQKETEIVSIDRGVRFTLPSQPEYSDGWFSRGRVLVRSGAAKGAIGVVKQDREVGGSRLVETWEILSPALSPGDLVRLEAGCDKRIETCRVKFDNLLNFRGFPDIPGEDWLTSYPVRAQSNDGGSRRT